MLMRCGGAIVAEPWKGGFGCFWCFFFLGRTWGLAARGRMILISAVISISERYVWGGDAEGDDCGVSGGGYRSSWLSFSVRISAWDMSSDSVLHHYSSKVSPPVVWCLRAVNIFLVCASYFPYCRLWVSTRSFMLLTKWLMNYSVSEMGHCCGPNSL